MTDTIADLTAAFTAVGLNSSTAERNAYGNVLIRLTPNDTAALARLLNLGDAWSLAMGLPPLGIRFIACCVTPETSVITLTDDNTRHLATRIRYAL